MLRLADANLILAQRLGEWIGHAPALEEDLGLANTALDLMGQARLLLTYAGEIEGRGRDEDALAFLREEREFLNPTLVEQPNGRLWPHHRPAVPLRRLAARALRRSRGVDGCPARGDRGQGNQGDPVSPVVQLGLGRAARRRHGGKPCAGSAGAGPLWPLTNELFDADELDQEMIGAGIAPPAGPLAAAWSARVDAVLAEATLERPAPSSFRWYGKQGRHSEHLGYILAEMQHLQRTYPGASGETRMVTSSKHRRVSSMRRRGRSARA